MSEFNNQLFYDLEGNLHQISYGRDKSIKHAFRLATLNKDEGAMNIINNNYNLGRFGYNDGLNMACVIGWFDGVNIIKNMAEKSCINLNYTRAFIYAIHSHQNNLLLSMFCYLSNFDYDNLLYESSLSNNIEAFKFILNMNKCSKMWVVLMLQITDNSKIKSIINEYIISVDIKSW